MYLRKVAVRRPKRKRQGICKIGRPAGVLVEEAGGPIGFGWGKSVEM